jgi:TonB family protein
MSGVGRFFLSERRLLIWMLAASFAAHVVAFYVFTVTDTVKTTGLGARPHVGWMPPRALGRPGVIPLHYVVAETLDPSLMSLPSARGFSNKLWERDVATTYRGVEWTVAPAFLDVKSPATVPDLLPQAPLMQFVQSSAREYVAATEEPVEPLDLPVVVNRSVIRVAGPLQERAVLSVPALPTMTSVNALRPTRLRVVVSGDGVVRYVMVDRSSGDESADARAQELARQIRFEPLSDPDSRVQTWGVVRFLWATEPPATTEKPAGSAQP